MLLGTLSIFGQTAGYRIYTVSKEPIRNKISSVWYLINGINWTVSIPLFCSPTGHSFPLLLEEDPPVPPRNRQKNKDVKKWQSWHLFSMKNKQNWNKNSARRGWKCERKSEICKVMFLNTQLVKEDEVVVRNVVMKWTVTQVFISCRTFCVFCSLALYSV